jgi:MGT family glycosyltransferase
LVYVTLGTVFNDPEPRRMILAALVELPVRVLVTVGPQSDPSALGPQPTNLRAESYVPQSAVFEHCDVVVSHGGSGTVLGALAFGLPQLCLPQGADQFLNAAAIATARAGLTISRNGFCRAAVTEAIERLLSQPSFRESATRVQESIATMPTVDEVATTLETLV